MRGILEDAQNPCVACVCHFFESCAPDFIVDMEEEMDLFAEANRARKKNMFSEATQKNIELAEKRQKERMKNETPLQKFRRVSKAAAQSGGLGSFLRKMSVRKSGVAPDDDDDLDEDTAAGPETAAAGGEKKKKKKKKPVTRL